MHLAKSLVGKDDALSLDDEISVVDLVHQGLVAPFALGQLGGAGVHLALQLVGVLAQIALVHALEAVGKAVDGVGQAGVDARQALGQIAGQISLAQALHHQLPEQLKGLLHVRKGKARVQALFGDEVDEAVHEPQVAAFQGLLVGPEGLGHRLIQLGGGAAAVGGRHQGEAFHPLVYDLVPLARQPPQKAGIGVRRCLGRGQDRGMAGYGHKLPGKG